MENTNDNSISFDRNTNTSNSTRANSTMNDSQSLLREFFVDELQDIYWAEKHLVETLPKMREAATTSQLKQAFDNHLSATMVHVSRLEEIFQMINEDATAKKCKAMAGITAEGEGIISETESNTLTRDVGLIFAAQKAEHYEIATYGCMAQLAKTLGRVDIAQILHETLEDEKEADQILTEIAENNINMEAASEKED